MSLILMKYPKKNTFVDKLERKNKIMKFLNVGFVIN